ncbi:MAG: GMC oxidoreductase [Nostoc sp.]
MPTAVNYAALEEELKTGKGFSSFSSLQNLRVAVARRRHRIQQLFNELTFEQVMSVSSYNFISGRDMQSDEAIAAYIRGACETMHHPVGTCKMGTDSMAVVDPALRVHGIEGLRIVDASIMPTITTGNTNAPIITIAEKAADLIKAAHSLLLAHQSSQSLVSARGKHHKGKKEGQILWDQGFADR